MAQDQTPPGAMAMSVESNSRADVRGARMGDLIARWLGWLAGLIAVIGLAGWVLGMPGFTSAVLGVQALVPMTAFTIALYSAAIISGTGSRLLPIPEKTFAVVALLVAMISLAYDAIEIARGTERFDATIVDDPLAGRALLPAPNTALSLALIGAALVLERKGSPSRSARYAIATAASIALLIAVLTLVGYAYGVDPLRGLPGHLSMAITTAVAISALALAVLLQTAGGGLGDLLQGRNAGSILARLAIPAAIVLPLVLGWLKVVGDRTGWFGPTMGTVVRTIGEMVLFAGLALLAIARLVKLDRDRERLIEDERAARAAAEEAQALLEEHAQALEEQAQELEMTVDELKSTNETLETQRAIAEGARQAERRAKNLLDAVIDQLPVGVLLARMPSGEIVRRNRVGEELNMMFTRGSPGLPENQRVWRRPDGRVYAPAELPLNRTVQTAEVIEQEEMETRLADGSPVHIVVSAAPVYENGQATMAVVVFSDVSSRRAAESTLAEREALLASFFRTPNVMVSLVEADVSPPSLAGAEVDYRFLVTNAEAAKLLGKPAHEVAGSRASEIGITAERRRSMVDLMRDARRAGKPMIVERPGLSRGSEVPSIQWMSVVVSPLADQPGRIPRFCLIATDVTHQRNLEAELRRAQKLEAVGRLAGGVAHDFNNLLTAITGFTRFALSDLPPDSPVRPDLDQALLAAERAGALTHQLLAFSRQQVLQPQVLNLNEVVVNVEPMLRRVIGEHIRIHLALSDTLGAVRADRGQLEQVLVNLVVNARDAMPEGGVLTIETSEVELDARQAAAGQGGVEGPHVMLAVTDTGVGMSAATRERIFEPFFTTKETGHGTGLGLATVFGIVRQSGGSIWVYSEPGQGSTFKIYLPRYDGPIDVVRAPTPVSVPRVSGRILLVEDDPAVRSITARVLRSAGYDVVEATTGREGRDLYTSLGGRVDLVLTDLVLPEMGGRAMVASLLADGMTTPVVYMSGYTAEAMSAQSVLEPDDLFVEKPFSPESLLGKVREAMHAGVKEPRRAG